MLVNVSLDKSNVASGSEACCGCRAASVAGPTLGRRLGCSSTYPFGSMAKV